MVFCEIPSRSAVSEMLRNQPVWHQQPCYVQSHLNHLSSSIWKKLKSEIEKIVLTVYMPKCIELLPSDWLNRYLHWLAVEQVYPTKWPVSVDDLHVEKQLYVTFCVVQYMFWNSCLITFKRQSGVYMLRCLQCVMPLPSASVMSKNEIVGCFHTFFSAFFELYEVDNSKCFSSFKTFVLTSSTYFGKKLP